MNNRFAVKENKKVMNNNLNIIKEGSVKFFIHITDEKSIPSKSMNVFYNRKMEINRDITNLAIIAYNRLINQKPLIIIDSMAASGISSIRMLKECENIKKIYINDINPIAIDLIHKNLSLNELNNQQVDIEVSRKDANYLFSEIVQNSFVNTENSSQKPNIISIDPFGTPNLYIDAALKAIQKVDGLLCITATDTAVLFGVRPISCIRKYMSKPLHTEYCKELGARILIYFISRIANVNKLGIIPLLTFYTSHFIRIFCFTFKNKNKISQYFNDYGFLVHCSNCNYHLTIQDNLLEIPKKCPICKEHNSFQSAGPLWVNEIHNLDFVNEMINLNQKSNYTNKKKIDKLLHLIEEEIGMPIFYYNIHNLSKNMKISNIPKLTSIISSIKKQGYQISRTHFDFQSIKTNMNIESIKNILLLLEHT
ncbi:MAG: tRNA (guanine(10)-N(2))-dimethyltransferase [Promethearchaeota archaeon]